MDDCVAPLPTPLPCAMFESPEGRGRESLKEEKKKEEKSEKNEEI